MLLACAVAAAFVVAEVLVRLYQKTLACHTEEAVPEGLYRPDDRYGHALTPGYDGRLDGGCWESQVRISSEGLRGPEIGPRERGARRILLIGDSYIFGTGVDEEVTLPVLLQEAMEATSPPAARPVEVINAGVPGWTTAQPPLFVEENARRLQINEVILHLYLGNDVEERVRFEDRNAPTEESPEQPGRKPSPSRRSILNKSLLVRLVKGRWNKLAFESGARPQPTGVWFEIFRKEESQRVRRGYDLIGSDLERLSSFCSSNGIPLRVVVTPSWMQVRLPTEEEICSRFQCRADQIDARKPNRDIGTILQAHGIPYLDWTEELVRAHEEGRYDLDIGHWDAAGSRLAAEWLSAWLTRDPVVPEAEPAQ